MITGRSDATLNRGGVRLGTAELYGVVDELPQVADSLVVHLEDDGGGSGELMLFVVPADGTEFDDELAEVDRGRLALRALAPARPGRDHRGAVDPVHAHRQEAGGAGQADHARRQARRRGEPGRPEGPQGARSLRRARGR